MQLRIRCPECGHVSTEDVPTDMCVLVHDCRGCGAALRRRPGACCVFCSLAEPAQPRKAG